jgi:hypothetical protein
MRTQCEGEGEAEADSCLEDEGDITRAIVQFEAHFTRRETDRASVNGGFVGKLGPPGLTLQTQRKQFTASSENQKRTLKWPRHSMENGSRSESKLA